jgi:hypothetical protein
MGREGAEARVANPGPVLWMRDVNFSRLFSPAEVFMVPDLDDPSPLLAPVPVLVPKSPEGDPEAPNRRVERALGLLLAGPRGRYANLKTAIPPGTRLLDFRYEDNVATVNLDRRFTGAGGSGQLRVGQLVWTVNRLIPSAWVRIHVDGRAVRTVGVDRFPVARQWRRRDEPFAGMWPQRSQQRADDSILFVRRGEIWTIAPEPGEAAKPFELNAPSPKAAPTWSPDHRWMAFLTGGGDGQSLWLVQPGGKAFRPPGQLPGRLSAPSWSPDAKRVYVVSRSESGARLLEITRSTLGVRTLTFPPVPSGLELRSVTVSPDGAFVLAVADRPDTKVENAEAIPGGQLFLGQLGPDGVVGWSERQLAPGLGRVFSPVWVDPVTVGFIAETDNKDDLGRLWTVKSDGWNPTAILNDSDGDPIGDIGNRLTVDPSGRSLIVTVRSTNGAALWMVNRQGKSFTRLTLPPSDAFESDPSFASR